MLKISLILGPKLSECRDIGLKCITSICVLGASQTGKVGANKITPDQPAPRGAG